MGKISLTTKLKTKEQKITDLQCQMNDLFWLFRNGMLFESDFIKSKDKLNEQIIELRKEI
jgi:hypothetical protein